MRAGSCGSALPGPALPLPLQPPPARQVLKVARRTRPVPPQCRAARGALRSLHPARPARRAELPLGTCSAAAPLPPRQRPQLPHPAGGAAPPPRSAPLPARPGGPSVGRSEATMPGRFPRGNRPARQQARGTGPHVGHFTCSACREPKIRLRALRAAVPLSAPRGDSPCPGTAWGIARRGKGCAHGQPRGSRTAPHKVPLHPRGLHLEV